MTAADTAISVPGELTGTGSVPSICRELAGLLGLPPSSVGPDTRLDSIVTDSLALLLVAAWADDHGLGLDDPELLLGATARSLARGMDHPLGLDGPVPPRQGAVPLRSVCENKVLLRNPVASDTRVLVDSDLGDTAPVWIAGSVDVDGSGALSAILSRSLVHRVVAPRATPSRAIGHAVAYDADSRSGVAKVGVALLAPAAWPGFGAAAALLLAELLFKNWPLRKLTLETPAPVASAYMADLSTWCDLEGRLRQQVWLDGCYHDLLLWACTRDQLGGLMGQPASTLLSRRASSATPLGTKPWT